MSDVSESPKCAVCGQSLSAPQQDCPACGIPGPWQDLLAALAFARGCFAQWAKDRTIGERAGESIAEAYRRDSEMLIGMAKEHGPLPAEMMLMSPGKCWSCQADVAGAEEHCAACGAPLALPPVRNLRYWIYTTHQIKAHCDAGRLPLAQAHACMNHAKSQIAALRSRLEKDRLARVEPAVESESRSAGAARSAVGGDEFHAAGSSHEPHRPLWEILLDPRTIHWLLGLGGVLLVIGLVIWLAAVGVFKNPVIVAVSLGLGNAAALLAGWATIRFSRYQTVGRFVTLLACLVMPLNLWFYHAQGLITIDGHLWAAALVCCVLYLASALLLRDRLFVYVFVGGVAMTGLLMLADNGCFWEIAAPAAMLVVLGLISIHVERAFPEVEGPFSRRRFGMAFFQSGQALLAAGLLLVLGAQVAGDWLYRPLFEPFYQHWHAGPPEIVTAFGGKCLALALILAGTYAYFYSDIVVRRVGWYVYLAVFTILWAEMFVIELVAQHVAAEAAILALALTALAANLAQPKLLDWRKPGSPKGDSPIFADTKIGTVPLATTALSLIRAGQPLGLFLCTVPVLLGLVLHLRATYQPLNDLWRLPGGESYAVGWLYVVSMFATAVSCRVGAHLYRRTLPWLSAVYFFGTAAATLLGVTGLLSVCGIRAWGELAPLVMIVPILYIIAARLYRGHTQENPLVWVAHSATGVMIAAVVAAALNLTPAHVAEPIVGKTLNLLLAAFFGEAALFYALAGAFRRQGFNVYLGTAAACGAIWQLLAYGSIAAEYYTLTFALLGLVLLVCYRLAVLEWTGLAGPAFECANALMSLSFVAAVLIALSRLAADPAAIHVSLVLLLLALVALSLLAAWLVRDAAGRRWYLVTAIAEAGLTFITLQFISHLTLWEKIEIFSVVAGVAMLVIGHVGWHRECDGQSDVVTFSLLSGSLLVAIPLTIAVLIHRGRPEPSFSTLNELGMLVMGILLLATGFVFQLRATTITGAAMLMVYLLSLLLFINKLNVETAAIWLMIGGGVIVGAGIVLSVYRERLLTLPDRVRRREGVFRVLGWR